MSMAITARQMAQFRPFDTSKLSATKLQSTSNSFLAASRMQPRPILRLGPVVAQEGRGRGGGRGQGGAKPGGRGGRGKKGQDEGQRLSKVLAEAGIASRRASEELIFEGRVKVNGEVEMAPQTRVVRSKDDIEVDGKAIRQDPIKKWYFAVNKPRGYTCMTSTPTDEDWEERRSFLDLFDDWSKTWKRQHNGQAPPRLQVAGNLDVNATGLMFVTNDGKWASKVTSRTNGITREYTVATQPKPSKKQLQMIADGAYVDEAEEVFLQPEAVGTASESSDRIRIVVGEGSARQVRTLIESCGLRVNNMKRVRVGGYRMPRGLGLGTFQELKPHELRRLLDRGADASI